jgi:hypothetical protein
VSVTVATDTPRSPAKASDRTFAAANVAWATAAGAVALAAYVRTLAPGLVADVDSAMFQFVGRVLGVAHNPGYPLYVLLTHPVSYLPLGSLAYRINLFSALMGAVAVALVFLVARRLGCCRAASLAAALGLAFGRIFWSQAVVAEVYTLHAAIVAGVLLALLVWQETRRQAAYITAVALFAAGLGNHTTIVGFAPGIALFVLLVDRRFALRARTIALTAAILAAGLLQYLFVLFRSLQPEAYVESRATTMGALPNVMLGGQFRDRLFAFGWRTVLAERLPSLASLLVQELTLVGIALAVWGSVWLIRRRPATAVLLLGGCGTVFAFALNYSVIDTPVFLIPSVLVLWLIAACGLERIVRLIGPHRSLAVLAGAASLALPLWLLASNFKASDRSRDVQAAVELDRLFEALPDRSALVSEDFILDRMVAYKLLGEQSAGARRIEQVPRNAAAVRSRLARGLTVYGSRRAARALRHEGLDIGFDPLRLIEGRLDGRLARLPDGAIVAVAAPAQFARQFAAARGAAFGAIGGPATLAPVAANVAIVGVRGTSGAAVQRVSPLDVDLSLGADQEIGTTGAHGRAAIELRIGATEATIRYAGRDVLRTDAGIGVAIWTADGRLSQTAVLQPADGFRIPLHSASLPFYIVRGVMSGQTLDAQEWTDLSAAVATGSTMVRVPGGATLVVYVVDDGALDPRAFEWSDRARVDVAAFGADRRETLRARLSEDGVGTLPVEAAERVYRMEVEASRGRSVSVVLALGGVPSRAIGRVTRSGVREHASAYAIDTRGLLRVQDRETELLLTGRDEQAQLIGSGWSGVESDEAGPYRWMTARDARLVLPASHAGARRIRLQVLHTADDGAAIGLRMNGTELSALPLRAGWHTYEWTVPDGLIREGANEAVVERRGADALEHDATGRSRTAVGRLALIGRAR